MLLPRLVSSGVGALIFTGLGSWSGIAAASLKISGVSSAPLGWGDLLWVVPVALVAAFGAQLARRLGLWVAHVCAGYTLMATTAAGLLVGACAAAYTLITGHSVLDVLQSGQSTLPALVSSPYSWSIATLSLMLAFKGLAYGLSLGSFGGGPPSRRSFWGPSSGCWPGPCQGWEPPPGSPSG